MSEYNQPAKGEKFAPRDNPQWVGKLFLIWPESVDNVVFKRDDGSDDPTDIVTATVAIIDLPDPQTGNPTLLEGARIGGKAIVPQLKPSMGKKVLGRLAQSPPKGQKSGAYFIADWTLVDVQMAEQYEAAFPRVVYQQPVGQSPAQSWGGAQPTPPAAAQAGWGAPAPAQNGWGASAPTASAPTPQPSPVTPWPDGLREFLTSKGIQTDGMDEGTARQIAATFQ